MSKNDPTSRAFAAWFRSCAKENAIPAMPSNTSGERTLAGKKYVILENCRGLMAVYRVRPCGLLKRLHRWPSEFNA